jgi:hypothetical protein
MMIVALISPVCTAIGLKAMQSIAIIHVPICPGNAVELGILAVKQKTRTVLDMNLIPTTRRNNHEEAG